MINIFITGGVCSGLGKGITAAALGRLLKQRGLRVSAQKLDPYMNVDPGTMSPFQHGEVFVTDDGAETDLDLGHYERFMDENLSRYSSLTAGQVYSKVLAKERAGGYLGGTVQVIPHVTEEIKKFIYAAANNDIDILITEIGGTTGDIESQPFIEAIRQIALERENCLFIHVTLVPYLKASGEHKSKPTQHSVKELRSMGISPHIIVVRADEPIKADIKKKIGLFSNVKDDCVIENTTQSSIYEAPLMLHKEGLDRVVCRELGLQTPEPDLLEWQEIVRQIKSLDGTEVTIAIVGKYASYRDAYFSISEALHHAGAAKEAKINIKWVDCEDLTIEKIKDINAMIIPGGFGDRGIEEKITACRYARENNIPYLGISLGMQIAVIEYARNICGLATAHSEEFSKSGKEPHPVIHTKPGQKDLISSGGTMRLGTYPCEISPNSQLAKLYDSQIINERHRHRYELNNKYREILTNHGMIISGNSPDGNSSDGSLAEVIELPSHPFFIGVQFHPEFKSRPNKPHPLFLGLIGAAKTV